MEAVFTVTVAHMDVWLVSSCLFQTCQQVKANETLVKV